MLGIASANYEGALRFYERSYGIVLIKSFRELEGKYIDYVYILFAKKIVQMGLLIPDPAVHDHDEGMDTISWLGEKAKSSMVIKQVVVENIGVDIRRRTKEMSDNLKRKGDVEIDGAEKELLQLCGM
ncbi:hypothetical protein FNV43_RR25504 [Rhamnella rubrinervis]|uniref:Uncharacterized protein n=1 Tax=Rhamnella rubrinervis TaxID=2594499 RepID=A0A8K0DT97_9ROSA|nr:hypothetical protein FNV43_RR25504 [Rhamnella rubrinervis]